MAGANRKQQRRTKARKQRQAGERAIETLRTMARMCGMPAARAMALNVHQLYYWVSTRPAQVTFNIFTRKQLDGVRLLLQREGLL